MMRRVGRLMLVSAIGIAASWLAGLLLAGPERVSISTSAFDGTSDASTCDEMNPAWSEIGIDLASADSPIEPGRVFRLSDGTIAVLVVVTAANADGQATAFDFAASVRVSAVIIRAGDDRAYVPFDPPTRNGTDLAAPDTRGIDDIGFCYRNAVPKPPPPGATTEPGQTPAVETIPEAPSPTPAETLIYGVPEIEGFDAWTAALPQGWTVSAGWLVTDGSSFQGYVQPPRTMDRDDYAVEAEIRVVEEPSCAANFGIIVRGSESGFYASGVEWVCEQGPALRLWALDRLLAQDSQPVDQEWHIYRLAVDGDRITVSIDGAEVLQATDASFASGGQIALWSSGVKLNVRAFRVLVAS